MARPKFDAEHAARVLILAEAVGDDEAAKTAGVTPRTIQRWRARVAGDSSLSEAITQKVAKTSAHLDGVYRDFMRSAVNKLGALVEEADVDKIHQVAGAVKIVGDLMNFRSAVGVEEPEKGAAGGGQSCGTGPGPANPEAPAVIPIRGLKRAPG